MYVYWCIYSFITSACKAQVCLANEIDMTNAYFNTLETGVSSGETGVNAHVGDM